jgi:hypothetical protein
MRRAGSISRPVCVHRSRSPSEREQARAYPHPHRGESSPPAPPSCRRPIRACTRTQASSRSRALEEPLYFLHKGSVGRVTRGRGRGRRRLRGRGSGRRCRRLRNCPGRPWCKRARRPRRKRARRPGRERSRRPGRKRPRGSRYRCRRRCSRRRQNRRRRRRRRPCGRSRSGRALSCSALPQQGGGRHGAHGRRNGCDADCGLRGRGRGRARGRGPGRP